MEVQEVSVESKSPEQSGEPDAVARAREFGIDITVLIENLKLMPTESLEKLRHVVAFLEQARWGGDMKRKGDVS